MTAARPTSRAVDSRCNLNGPRARELAAEDWSVCTQRERWTVKYGTNRSRLDGLELQNGVSEPPLEFTPIQTFTLDWLGEPAQCFLSLYAFCRLQ